MSAEDYDDVTLPAEDGVEIDVEPADEGSDEQSGPASVDDGDDAASEASVEAVPDSVTDEGEDLTGAPNAAPDDSNGGSEELGDRIGTEIHELAAERDQFRDIAQRLQADFENYRKRMSSQIAAEVERATGKLAEALLPVLDAAEAAYVQHPDEVGPLLNLMLSELRKHGLESVDLLDKPFDPNLAEAVAHEAGEGGDPVVAEVLRSGYSWNGRTLRPAMVRTTGSGGAAPEFGDGAPGQ
jgi:molecular chaperone GrpE